MNDNTYYKSCTKCGRPQTICKGECCNKPKCGGGCQCKEYGCKHNACIRQVEPSCQYTAVIPSITVEDVSNLKDLADCFVHVSTINTTFYIDDKHRVTTIWAGPVEVDDYDYQNNPLNLRSQTAYDFDNNRAIYYNKSGQYRLITLTEE